MLEKVQTLLSKWFGEALIVFTAVLALKLTFWGQQFAGLALAAKADMMGTAAIIGAVAGIPVAILGMVLNKYIDLTKDSNG